MESDRPVVERLKASLEAASAHNPNDADKPMAILWTDRYSARSGDAFCRGLVG